MNRGIFPVSLDFMVDDSFGLDHLPGWRGTSWSAAHRHQELELNLMFQGSMTYLFGAETLELSKGQLALFWATTPHRLMSCEEDYRLWLDNPAARQFLALQLTRTVSRNRLARQTRYSRF